MEFRDASYTSLWQKGGCGRLGNRWSTVKLGTKERKRREERETKEREGEKERNERERENKREDRKKTDRNGEWKGEVRPRNIYCHLLYHLPTDSLSGLVNTS